jgi:hypothetical protein
MYVFSVSIEPFECWMACIRARGIILPASARKQTKTGHVQNCHTVSHGLINNFSVFEDNDVIFGVARDITAYDCRRVLRIAHDIARQRAAYHSQQSSGRHYTK